MNEKQAYEAAGDRYVAAQAELNRARHLLELAENEMDAANDALADLEARPGIPAYTGSDVS